MKTYLKYKRLAITYWEALSDSNLTEAEKQRDRQVFIEFFNKFLYAVYGFFGVFSFISLYLLVTRVIL
jgi:hypothetical protein